MADDKADDDTFVPARCEDAADIDARLRQLGITLPTPAQPVANYVNFVRTGNLLFMAGAGPLQDDNTWITGRVGADMSIDDAYAAANRVGLVQLANMKAALGDLGIVRRIVKVLGMVNSDPTFTSQPKVINGFSDLMVNVFGDRGKHARSAVGMAALPFGIPVEVELVVELCGHQRT